MARFTAKQIYDLNNSMSAAQAVNLGTVLGLISASATMVSGVVTPISASQCLVDTGLTSINAFAWSFTGSPSGFSTVSASFVGSQVNIKSWNGYSAASGFCQIRWIAWGEL